MEALELDEAAEGDLEWWRRRRRDEGDCVPGATCAFAAGRGVPWRRRAEGGLRREAPERFLPVAALAFPAGAGWPASVPAAGGGGGGCARPIGGMPGGGGGGTPMNGKLACGAGGAARAALLAERERWRRARRSCARAHGAPSVLNAPVHGGVVHEKASSTAASMECITDRNSLRSSCRWWNVAAWAASAM